MNKTKVKFEQDIETLTQISRIDVTKMGEWFKKTLEALEALGSQKDRIKHPGYKGDTKETLLRNIIKPMVPGCLRIERGYVVNQWLSESKEQDLMIVDRDAPESILPGDGARYIPWEYCFGSIQVKSALNKTEIQRAALNCISMKKVYGMPEDEEERIKAFKKICYGVFAYRSPWTLKRTAEIVNDELRNIDKHLRPNLFYILGKGMLIPSPNENIPLEKEAMLSGNDFYPVYGVGAEPAIPISEAFAFLWFVTNIIDHCMKERSEIVVPEYKGYWLTTIALQSAMNKVKKKNEAENKNNVC